MKPIPTILRLWLPAFICIASAWAEPLPVPALPSQANLDAAIAGLQQRYANVGTLEAAFRQTYRGPGVDETESGIMYMKKPGLMRWEYRDPEVKLFIADGRDTYLYTPKDRQVLVRRFSAADLRSTPLQFLLGQGDIRQTFEVSWEPEPAGGTRGSLRLRLTPLAAESDYAYVTIECDAHSFDVRRIEIHEPTGNVSEFELSQMKTNVKVDSRQFQFKIPKGVEVVRLDEK